MSPIDALKSATASDAELLGLRKRWARYRDPAEILLGEGSYRVTTQSRASQVKRLSKTTPAYVWSSALSLRRAGDRLKAELQTKCY